MYPPAQGFNLDIEAISGILGSVSIACWVVVFSPQIFENFSRGSADGLSVIFIISWLSGDVFNLLGAVLQGVLPTMVILAVYYTLADIVLLGQCFYYKGFTFRDKVAESGAGDSEAAPDERTALLPQFRDSGSQVHGIQTPSNYPERPDRRDSHASFREQLLAVDATHLSPATPLVPDLLADKARAPPRPRTTVQRIFFNAVSVLLVCTAGVLGWWLANRNPNAGKSKRRRDALEFNVLGQVFGYVSALLYLGSRVPQLLLNHRRKSTEGLSMIFFLFAWIGNFTYVASILAYAPVCKSRRHCGDGEAEALYWRYVATNLSWLLGSAGTLLLDAGVFTQYFMYKRDDEDEEESDQSDGMLQVDAEEAVVVSRSPQNRRAVAFEDDG